VKISELVNLLNGYFFVFIGKMDSAKEYLDNLLEGLNESIIKEDRESAFFFVREFPYSVIKYVDNIYTEDASKLTKDYLFLLELYSLKFEKEENVARLS